MPTPTVNNQVLPSLSKRTQLSQNRRSVNISQTMWGTKDYLYLAVTVLSMIHILYVILTMAFRMECMYQGPPTNKHLCCNILMS